MKIRCRNRSSSGKFDEQIQIITKEMLRQQKRVVSFILDHILAYSNQRERAATHRSMTLIFDKYLAVSLFFSYSKKESKRKTLAKHALCKSLKVLYSLFALLTLFGFISLNLPVRKTIYV